MSVETSRVHEGTQQNGADDGGCAFVLDGIGRLAVGVNFCNEPRQPGSAYCPGHHANCHLPNGSEAERQQLREIEALARAVGGRQGRAARHPPTRCCVGSTALRGQFHDRIVHHLF
jgi:hypothetical protein